MNKDHFFYRLVENPVDLNQIVAQLTQESVIGVDLEADSLFHYRESVCLLQISTKPHNFLFDTQAICDLSCLQPVFTNATIMKIFHGADYDIRLLHRDYGIEVHALFDTQLAARFLGIRETGLASLLKGCFGLQLDKKYQKKDWSKRPLSKEMLKYAVNDTTHLIRLASHLRNELQKKDRLSWLEEECDILSKVRTHPPVKGPLFMKFKGAAKLNSRSLAILEAILQFREDMARKMNRPAFKVLGNGPIMEMVVKKPSRIKDFDEITGINRKQINNFGPILIRKIHKAMQLPDDVLPVFAKKARTSTLGRKLAKRIKIIKEWREIRANDLGIDPALVCSNAQIQALVLSNLKLPKDIRKVEGIRNWQHQEFGSELCTILFKAL